MLKLWSRKYAAAEEEPMQTALKLTTRDDAFLRCLMILRSRDDSRTPTGTATALVAAFFACYRKDR